MCLRVYGIVQLRQLQTNVFRLLFFNFLYFFCRCPAANNFHMSVLNIFGNILPRYIESGSVQQKLFLNFRRLKILHDPDQIFRVTELCLRPVSFEPLFNGLADLYCHVRPM